MGDSLQATPIKCRFAWDFGCAGRGVFFFSLYQLRAKRQIRTMKRMGKSGIKQRFRLFYILMDEIIKEFPTDTSNDKSLVPLSPGVYPMVEVLYIDFVFGD